MTTGERSQCSTCKHWRTFTGLDDATCDAFPEGIPRSIFWNEQDHRRPAEGDGGLRWESDGRPHPID